MQSIRRIIDDAPESIAIPEELRHRRIELIIRPLPDEAVAPVRTELQAQSHSQPLPSETDALPTFRVEPGTPMISLQTLRQHWEEE